MDPLHPARARFVLMSRAGPPGQASASTLATRPTGGTLARSATGSLTAPARNEKARKGLHPAARLPNDARASDEAALTIVGPARFPTPLRELNKRGGGVGKGGLGRDRCGISEGRPDPVDAVYGTK